MAKTMVTQWRTMSGKLHRQFHCTKFSGVFWQFHQLRQKTMFWFVVMGEVTDFSHFCTTWAWKDRLLSTCSFSSGNESIFAYKAIRARGYICIGSTANCSSISVV
jgi:hypothetical protein